MKPTKSKENTIEELDKIMENLDLKESSGYSDTTSDGNSKNISSYYEEDFIAYYGNVSKNSEDTWRSGLELYDDEQTIFSLGSSHGVSNKYQVYAIIDDTSEELNIKNNPIINPENIRKGTNHMAGETTETMAGRVKIQLTTAELDTIRAAVKNGAAIPVEAWRELVMGYHYALHRQALQLMQEIVK
jgi:hypothetical protein